MNRVFALLIIILTVITNSSAQTYLRTDLGIKLLLGILIMRSSFSVPQ